MKSLALILALAFSFSAFADGSGRVKSDSGVKQGKDSGKKGGR